VGDVIVGGVAPPPGETLWAQSRWIASDGTLRNYVLNEPRGGVFRHVNLLVPPVNPEAQMGFIIMEPEDTPPMSGSNAICVATAMLQTDVLPMSEPVTDLVLEAPGGLIRARAACRDGVVQSVTIENQACFVDRQNSALNVEGLGALTVDTAYGGDSFVIVDADALQLSLTPAHAKDLAELGVRIARAATEELGFRHPEIPDWRHISFCLFAERPEKKDGVFSTRHAVAIRPGKIDRSPTGTGVSAHLALMHARGEARAGDKLCAHSIISSEFIGRIERETMIGAKPAIIPSITGRAWITGERLLRLDPTDPWPEGYRLSDTWPQI